MKLGHLELHLLNDGMFTLDGGTMFGMVPKALWAKVCPCDAENLIELRTGVLLIRDRGENTLVDAGLGGKLDEKMRKIYRFAGARLMDELAVQGLGAGDIHRVILTHLHLDHAGGCTRWSGGGAAVPTFPNAEYVVQAREWVAALDGHPLTRGSYIPEDFLPLEASGQVRKVEGDVRLTDAIAVQWTGGHTAGHQMVLLESGGERGVFPGDLIPTAHHLSPSWVMSYDNYPLDIAGQRRSLLNRALAEDWLLILQHDPKVAMGRVRRPEGSRRMEFEPVPATD